jgi:hypothetical protein
MQQIARLKLYPSAPKDGGSELSQKTEMLRLEKIAASCISNIRGTPPATIENYKAKVRSEPV